MLAQSRLLSAAVVLGTFLSASAFGAASGAPRQPPSVVFGDLYQAVEMGPLFADQKTFADAIPKRMPTQILRDYQREKNRPGFSLARFISQNFSMPFRSAPKVERRPSQDVRGYIFETWAALQRTPDAQEAGSSLLPLRRPYVVPGGRFSEIYYWDSYFTMLGLEQDGRYALVRDMLINIASLIQQYGHMPNGNRTYYLSRSQPPFFAEMVDLVAVRDGPMLYRTYLPLLQTEYDYWMEGADHLRPGFGHRHVVRLHDGTLLNRYWDDRAAPRDESFREDVETARMSDRPAAELYRDLRAGSESGWDFSSRWLDDGVNLNSIHTTQIAPVDLNCLMLHLEQVLAKGYELSGDDTRARLYAGKAKARADAINRLMWSASDGLYTDYIWRNERRGSVFSAATVFPLYFRVATASQAHAVARTLRKRFLDSGGLATTLTRTGQQWDQPNGWAPLQYLAVEGLNAYGEKAIAAEIARRWIRLNVRAYEASGILQEKYDVETVNVARPAGGGEYSLQVGFGWTNGVLAKLMAEYLTRDRPPASDHKIRQN
jgi:alpha,alpha-trehalase